MQLDGKGEFISRFIGLLHIPQDAFGLEIDYDTSYERHLLDQGDQSPPVPSAGSPNLDDFDSVPSPRPPEGFPDVWNLAASGPYLHPPAPGAPPPAHGVPPPPPPTHSPAPYGGGGGGGDIISIDVTYQPGGEQEDLRVVQVNALRADEVVQVDNQPPAWPEHHGPDLLTLQTIADDQVPQAYAHTNTQSPDSIVATLTDLGSHSSGDPPATLTEGMFIDHQSVDPNGPLPPDPTTAIPTLPTDHHANMAVVEAGSNWMANFAGVGNDAGQTGTLVVLGDSFKSDAIVQTNVLVDKSTIVGTSPTADLQSGGDAAHNVAQFLQSIPADANPYTMGFFGGVHWHVDTVQGNFYNVNLVTQYNYMTSNDLVQQSAMDHYKFIETGGNEQGNQLIATNYDSVHYDLIVATGNYYSANWIFQTNVLLNNDYVSVNAGAGGAGQETVSTGANWLMNSAQIMDFSVHGQALTPELQAVASALQSGDTSLDASAGLAVPGNGTMDLNVLFINGNYYDMKVLNQTNVVNDSDTVLQTLANGESGYVSTGGNSLANQAILIDVGPIGGQYVGGQQYSEAVLVQTNIISQSANTSPTQGAVVTNDPQQLAPEAAAIIQHDPGPTSTTVDQPAVSHSTDTVSHATPDPLSSVIS